MNSLRRFLIILGMFTVLAAQASAQLRDRYNRRYEPARPTLSPYLNLTRPDWGTLPNYQSLVRPMLRQQELNQRAARILDRNAQRLQQLGERTEETQELIRGWTSRTPTVANPTGKSSIFGAVSGFRSYSHYYPSKQGRGGR